MPDFIMTRSRRLSFIYTPPRRDGVTMSDEMGFAVFNAGNLALWIWQGAGVRQMAGASDGSQLSPKLSSPVCSDVPISISREIA